MVFRRPNLPGKTPLSSTPNRRRGSSHERKGRIVRSRLRRDAGSHSVRISNQS